jgi:hypothetical protein
LILALRALHDRESRNYFKTKYDTNTSALGGVTMSNDIDMMAELEKLRAENEKLKTTAGKKREISFKVSQKGAMSVYGLGRFPVTLYKEQWERLLAKLDDLKKFIKDNDAQLKGRG